MRKVDDGGKKRKKKEKEKNGVFSGHYVIASSLPPERLRPNDDRWNAARSCQKKRMAVLVATTSLPAVYRPNGYARTTTTGTPHARAKKRGEKGEKTDDYSGHYVIASS